MKDAAALIADAMARRHLLRLSYNGDERLVQPYVYGKDYRGQHLLSAYQVAGASTSGASEGWKFFRMDRVAWVEITPLHFTPRAEYQPGDRAFGEIWAEV